MTTMTTAHAAAIEPLMRELIAHYEHMLALAARHRAALAGADTAALELCTQEQAQAAARLADLEGARRALVASGGLSDPARFDDLARPLPPSQQESVRQLGGRLRELLLRLQKEHAAIRAATISLVAHIDGLVQHIARRLSHSGTYGPRGRVEQGDSCLIGIDLRL